MGEVTATLVKELRDKTGAGMMDCKKALIETTGDIEAATDWLRKQGLAAAAKKSGRVASEGLVGVCVSENKGAMVEVNSETDFVARNDDFQRFVSTVARLSLETNGDVQALNSLPYPETGRSVADELTNLIATIGENISLRRAVVLSVDKGMMASYVHSARASGMGKIGVLLGLQLADLDAVKDMASLQTIGKQLAMHVAATSPQSISRNDLDPMTLEREKGILIEQARASGKPENILEKMVEGRLRKFYEEVCLLDQTYVIDGENQVSKVLDAAANELGTSITVRSFVRFALGEGIEKKNEDFASEVSKAVGG
jgi:elongation factor Ts